MYEFNTCKNFIRTIQLIIYSKTKVEDLDTDLEDHIADETRYMCMAKPIKPVKPKLEIQPQDDPLNMLRRN